MGAIGPELLGSLVERHAAALVLYARAWCACPEDVVQEAFVKLAGQDPPPEQPAAWLYRVVRNGAVSAGRGERRRRHNETAAAREAGRASAWFVSAEGDDLDAAAAQEALAGLPPEHREVIVAHLWGGLTFEQIAAVAGCSSSTAHRWYLAGLAGLRQRLGVPCPNPPTRG